jgi:hypothetical protein
MIDFETEKAHFQARRGYERVHRFSQFQIFSVDSAEAVKEPSPAKFRNSVADM